MTPEKKENKEKYKSVLSMVWDISDSLWFKLRFTWTIFLKRLRGK